ncbi:AmpG family muropeptide MFS transporter, partial [Pseudomonas syringae]
SPSALVLLRLGFGAGMPSMLVLPTLSVWVRAAGVARETIGYARLIGLAYAFKWVWSPLLDQWRLPLLGKLGRRRSWLVLAQRLVILGLIGMGFCDPHKHLSWLIAIAVVVAFASAPHALPIAPSLLATAQDTPQAALAARDTPVYPAPAPLA